ncbi:glycerol-3-phosphate dehydrogenase [Oceanobacillus zhaokaii]|uniref:Glycerol-3-phosphate dehydrogenase n=1 Tax=Oceanobacillus zhaokaii TaxID=2052660 RepID=A0A345PJ02_9BACI|nr:glycerol-3-phosphate dehydrogenase/oxidase [Oceanobacillus zhaokaii]AXI09982.1 glycerol-3-phosphate dehydrogenase [Oceanobacillus zhaokaii]
MTILSSFNRKDTFNKLENESLDVLIVGGGITGAGIALDAVTRGLKVGLVEMQDFAGGTSSRSTKLVHGGLRYLQQFEIKMVAEIGKEREIVYENGPHVTTPEWMMLPFHKGSTLGPFTTNIGLRVYDFLAGVKKSERRKMFSPEQALQKEPLIKKDGLKGAGYYVEYKTDDARLTIEVMKKAVERGAHAINYAKVTEFIYDESHKISGITVEDQITQETYSLHAKKIINAGGPWVDELREIDGSKKGKTLHLTKGIHLVFPKEVFPLEQAIYFDTPDGRMIFAIPRDNKTYVGTTDTTYEGDIAHPVMTEADETYVLDAINYMFPSLNMQKKDVESSWAGIRPLIEEEGKNSPSEISRKDEIFVSDSGLISMAGGKLTGYRKMAEQAVDTVVEQLKTEEGILYTKSETIDLPISGGDVGGSKGYQTFLQRKVADGVALGLNKTTALDLASIYGSNVDTLYDIYQDRKEEAEKEGIDPAVFAKLIYAMENEAAYKPVDFFIRRTGALFFDINWVRRNKENVIQYMAKTLRWSGEQKQRYIAELEQLLHEAVTPTI